MLILNVPASSAYILCLIKPNYCFRNVTILYVICNLHRSLVSIMSLFYCVNFKITLRHCESPFLNNYS